MTKTRIVPQKTWNSLSLLWLAPMAFCVLASWSGCKTKTEDQAPPPLPTAPATEAPVATQALTLAPEVDAAPPDLDAGADAADADAGKKYTGTVQSLSKCCAALKQNAASAPPPTNLYMMTAAGLCQGLQNADRTAALAQIRSALRGANLPSACY